MCFVGKLNLLQMAARTERAFLALGSGDGQYLQYSLNFEKVSLNDDN